MKTILVLSYSPLSRDPRVRRQILALKDDYKIIAAGQTSPEISGVDYISLSTKKDFRRLLLRIKWVITGKRIKRLIKSERFKEAYWHPKHESIYQSISKVSCHGIIANDVDMLPISLRLAKKNNAKVYFDAHEYSTRQNIRRKNDYKPLIYEWVLKEHLGSPAAFTTVCSGLAKEYFSEFGRLPEIILNSPLLENLTPSIVKSDKIHLIHHGIAAPKRKIETLIKLMPLLDHRFHLNLYLVDYNKSYLDRLKEMSKGRNNITFHNPIKTESISRGINRYDIGVFMLGDDSFNMEYALPNKFFEFIQARLSIAIWPSPEMARIVNDHKLGWVTKERTIEAMATLLNNLSSDEIFKAKEQANTISQEFSSEKSFSKLKEIACLITGH